MRSRLENVWLRVVLIWGHILNSELKLVLKLIFKN